MCTHTHDGLGDPKSERPASEDLLLFIKQLQAGAGRVQMQMAGSMPYSVAAAFFGCEKETYY
jgi:hypothetical protein